MRNVSINKRNLGIAVGLIVLIILCVSCGSGTTEKGEKASPDWGRGIVVAEDAVGAPGILVSEDGKNIQLVWPRDTGDGIALQYRQLNENGRLVFEKEFRFADQVRLANLIPASGDSSHLIWSSRQDGERKWGLWHALLSSDAELVGEPVLLSNPEENVGHYVAISDGSGGAVLIWGSGSQGDIFLGWMDPGGRMPEEPILVTSQGESPGLAVDESGRVHITWLNGTRVEYGRADLGDLSQIEHLEISRTTLGTGDALYGPVLGYSDGWLYAFWSVLKQTGTEAGTASTEYIAFSADQPSFTLSERVIISPAEEQVYMPYHNGITISSLIAPPDVPWAASEYILHPSVMIGGGDVLGVAIVTSQQYRTDAHLQIVFAVFSDGKLSGYSYAGRTQGISDDPVLYIDESGDLYMLWREGASGSKIYFTSTKPKIASRLDRIEAGDVVSAVLSGGMESFVSITLMPVIGFGWLLPGLLIMGIWKLIRDEESVRQPASLIVLVLAVLVFQFVKSVTLPTIVTYVPFSAWLYIPEFLEMPLRIGVPLLIFAISIVVANRVRQKRSDSAALFFFVMAVTDSLLSLAVYGVNFLGVY